MSTIRGLEREDFRRITRCRIVVVDDHPLVCEALADLINSQEDMACCGTARNTQSAQETVTSTRPDLVLVDLHLGNEDGVELIKLLRARTGGLRILVVSQLDESVYGEGALKAGALGYVMKEEATEKLLRAIRVVAAGRLYISNKLAALWLANTEASVESAARAGGRGPASGDA